MNSDEKLLFLTIAKWLIIGFMAVLAGGIVLDLIQSEQQTQSLPR